MDRGDSGRLHHRIVDGHGERLKLAGSSPPISTLSRPAREAPPSDTHSFTPGPDASSTWAEPEADIVVCDEDPRGRPAGVRVPPFTHRGHSCRGWGMASLDGARRMDSPTRGPFGNRIGARTPR